MNEATRSTQIEQQLTHYVDRLERAPQDWRAVHLHLSRLRAQNRRDYHLRIAASEFDPLLRRRPGELFQLSNDDLVCLVKDATIGDIDDVVLRLRYLFSNDPLLKDEDDEERSFCTWYDMSTDFADLRRETADWLDRAKAGDGCEPSETVRTPLDASSLARLQAGLAKSNIEGLLRRQSICTALPCREPRPVLSELYVSIRDLTSAFLPGVELTANQWLFRTLTETLDRRVLTALEQEPDRLLKGPTSLNFNVSTLLSPEFIAFDKKLQRGSDGAIVLELQLVDVFADLGAFVFARDFARERGYRICIDGVHHLHLPMISRRKLGADFVKVAWDPDLLDHGGEERTTQLVTAINRAGLDRVIICRCGSAEAIEWGQSLGLTLFQGRYIDSRLRAGRANTTKSRAAEAA